MDSHPPSPDNSEYENSSSTMEEDQVDIELQGETEQILAIEVDHTQEVPQMAQVAGSSKEVQLPVWRPSRTFDTEANSQAPAVSWN